MTAPTHPSHAALEVHHVFRAAREDVFHHWTHPSSIKRWFGGEKTVVHEAVNDVRVGGSYRIEFQVPEGGRSSVSGTYLEVEFPKRLVYSWRLEAAGEDTGETLVTVEFADLGGETEVALRHEAFPSVQLRDFHAQGWADCLEAIEALLPTVARSS